MGDIGQYFPSEEKEWENAKSEIFLIEVKKILISNGFKISNIDCTVILQKPKINSYIELIRNNISRILELNKNYVSIKATTTTKTPSIRYSARRKAIAPSAMLAPIVFIR